MLSHGDTPICQNFECLCQRAKTFCQTQIHGENIILILRSKVKVINVRDTLYHGDTLTCQTKYDCVKEQKSLVLNTKQCHKPYKFDLEVKVQGCIRIMNVLDTSSHGDRPICQIWYANVKANRSYRSYMKTWQKPLNLTLRSKVNIESGSWMYATHCLMVIHPCAKYGKPMSNHKKVMGRTRICTDRRTDRVIPIYSLNFVRGTWTQSRKNVEFTLWHRNVTTRWLRKSNRSLSPWFPQRIHAHFYAWSTFLEL